MKKTDLNPQRRKRLLIAGGVAECCLAGMLVLVIAFNKPALLANGMDLLRGVIGDQAVAQLEAKVLQMQDLIQKWKYSHGMAMQAAPWTVPSATPTLFIPTDTLLPTRESTPLLIAATPSPTRVSPTPVAWQLVDLVPLGTLQGEGRWTAYIQNATGDTVAYRTFLQPDPDRPYAITAIIAFNLKRTWLHFVLGTVEPYSPNSPKRSGLIPASDRMPGVLLAMFNGGFKARHGQFGAMAGGITALSARDGLGTLAIYNDGRVRMGEWGTDLTASTDMVAFRQNGPLMIHQGNINPEIYNNSPQDWGYTDNNLAPTWRSGVGLSADLKTLYYFCGPSLTVELLAKSMLASGVTEAMQLDINLYWVHFVVVRTNGKNLILEALFPDMMKDNLDRYLWPYTRDYFYVTGSP